MLLIGDVRERLTLIALDEKEYPAALETAAASGITGGTIYDTLLARCALKVKVEAIYTWNVKHFSHLGADLAARVKTPEL